MTFLKRAEKAGRRFLNPVETRVGGFDTIWKVLPLYLRNKEEKTPKRPLGPFRTDTAVYSVPSTDGLRVTWMGHSTTLLEMDGLRILIDPVWDERASPTPWFGPKRFFAPPLRFDEIPPIDVVLVSHDHYDHLGKVTVQRLSKLPSLASARWVPSLGVGNILRNFGVAAKQIAELDWTDSISVAKPDGAELKITALPARHFSGRGISNRFESLWSSFVLKTTQHNVYYGADSGWWPGFAEIGATYGPFDLTMLEIGAFNELWKDIHMGPDGAAQVFAELGGAGLLMPIHWGLFDLALHGWRQPIQRMIQVADEHRLSLWSPTPGAPTDVIAGVSLRSNWWQ